MSDQSITFFKKILSWLEKWKQLGFKPKHGTLSNETMSALSHTLSVIIGLCSHLLHDLKFNYVMLARMQTDNLEFRFERYHQLAGSNFHVSVNQIVEGEKKLKLMSALKLVSASKGSITLNDLTEPLQTVRAQQSNGQQLEVAQFLQFVNNSEKEVIVDDQMKVVIYIAGYAVFKLRQKL